MKRVTKLFSLSLIVILIDQVVKLVVKFNMEKGDAGQIKILGDFFKLHFIENNGAAFGLTLTELFNGMGAGMSESTGKLILSIFSIVAVAAIGVVLYKLKDHKSALPIFIALIFGGALGNIIDRTFYGLWFTEINDYAGGLFYGRVVDMFYLDIWKGYLPDWKYVPLFNGQYTALWPIFNIADAAISIGIVVILLFQGRFFKKDEEAREAAKLAKSPESTGKKEGSESSKEKPESSAEVTDEQPAISPDAQQEEAASNHKENINSAVAGMEHLDSESGTKEEEE